MKLNTLLALITFITTSTALAGGYPIFQGETNIRTVTATPSKGPSLIVTKMGLWASI